MFQVSNQCLYTSLVWGLCVPGVLPWTGHPLLTHLITGQCTKNSTFPPLAMDTFQSRNTSSDPWTSMWGTPQRLKLPAAKKPWKLFPYIVIYRHASTFAMVSIYAACVFWCVSSVNKRAFMGHHTGATLPISVIFCFWYFWCHTEQRFFQREFQGQCSTWVKVSINNGVFVPHIDCLYQTWNSSWGHAPAWCQHDQKPNLLQCIVQTYTTFVWGVSVLHGAVREAKVQGINQPCLALQGHI